MKLNNIKNVFISGASKGIGFELAKKKKKILNQPY